ncbi:hypothetical protein [Corynebacterium amycolatum]|uniref:hypothetical protein n=1 Tax=Corynebacterium amycolatum TaxID=43765 RepID=UPI00084805D7|nr:hypothetical protein [Corynebacterium amycolatum]MCA0443547.1 hypothetical protein [Corynebacterium amycolatum]ODQ40395.1 hypothetical protein BGC22_05460 [Corynebacterium amycolatum]
MSNSDLSAVEVTQENIDKLVADLRMFATGSYLQPEEREFWEPLFDESVADQVGEALREAAAGIDLAAELAVDKREEAATQAVENCLQRVAAIEHEHGGSIFDEELDEILAIINSATKAVGLDLPAVKAESYFEME